VNFPYSIFYREFESYILVASILHSKRRPDGWINREPE